MMHATYSETPHAASCRNLQRRFWTLAALATLTPVVILSGCNGSGDNGGPGTVNLPGGTLTPTATFTRTPTPTTGGTALNGRVTLDGGRQGFLSLDLLPGFSGTGTFSVSDPAMLSAKAGGIVPRTTLPPPNPNSIPTGTYPLTAGFYSDFTHTLLLSGQVPGTGAGSGFFNIVVSVSSNGTPSSFVVSSAGQNYFGSFSSANPTPTA